MVIKILQWNIWFRESPKNIVNFLKESGADVICAQEIMWDSRKNLNVAEYISENLSFEYFYRDGSTWDNCPEREALGNAIFSRFPIIDSNYVYLQQPKHNLPDASSEGRVYLEVKIDAGNKVLTVGTTHLSYSYQFEITDQRKDEVDTLLDVPKRKKKLLCIYRWSKFVTRFIYDIAVRKTVFAFRTKL